MRSSDTANLHLTIMSTQGGRWPWDTSVHVADITATTTRNLSGRGTVRRFSVVSSDDIEREVIVGTALDAVTPPGRRIPLTVGTSPPLSLGPEGMIMHFLLHSMELGINGIVFGPERSRRGADLSTADRQEIADGMTFGSTAEAQHQIANELGPTLGVDFGHMLWAGISLGAMKGIHFAARAPHHDRTMVHCQFVVPVAPDPMPAPTEAELRSFMLGELGAGFRAAREIIWKDVRRRTIGVHRDITRMARPGLLPKYLRSAPRDSVFRMFTSAWRDQVVTGDAGVAASLLPTDRLSTFEIFDRDEGSPVETWREKLAAQLAGGRTRLVVEHGLHTDAMRLSHQKRRAAAFKRLLAELDRGVPVDELTHPLDS